MHACMTLLLFRFTFFIKNILYTLQSDVSVAYQNDELHYAIFTKVILIV